MNNPRSEAKVQKLKWKKYTSTWHIEGVDQLFKKKVGFVKRSPTKVSDGAEYQWHVRFYATGFNDQFKGFVSLKIICSQEEEESDSKAYSPQDVFFKGGIAILNVNKEIIRFNSFPARSDCEYTEFKFIERSILRSHLQGCNDIYVYSEIFLQIVDDEEDIEFEKPVGGSKLELDFKMLLNNNEYSDIEIICSDGKKIRAHKAILATRSAVFSTMLKHDMLESKSNQIKISDCTSKTIELLLCFIYSGKTDIPNFETAIELRNQSEKYQLPELKLICVDYIVDNLKTSNICEVLILSHKIIAQELLIPALDFVVDNFESLSSDEIRNLSVKMTPSLMNSFFTKLSKRLKRCTCEP